MPVTAAPPTAAPPDASASAAGLELARRIDEADQQLGDADFAVDLGDGLALLSVAGLLADATTRASGAPGVDLSGAQALAEWLEDHLATRRSPRPPASPIRLPSSRRSRRPVTWSPSWPEVSCCEARGGDVRSAPTYREAVIAAFGATAAAAARDAGGAALLIATCGMCCIPASSISFELEGNASYGFLSGLALALQAQQRRLDPSVAGGRDALADAQSGVVARKLSQVGQLALELPPDRGGEGRPHGDFSGADVFAGALIELRADCADAGELLKTTQGRRDTFTSQANRMGIGQAIVIDHVERRCRSCARSR